MSVRVDCKQMEPGVSALQRFDGEDVEAAERRRLQAEQRRQWAAQQVGADTDVLTEYLSQMRDKDEARRTERERQAEYERRMKAIDDVFLLIFV